MNENLLGRSGKLGRNGGASTSPDATLRWYLCPFSDGNGKDQPYSWVFQMNRTAHEPGNYSPQELSLGRDHLILTMYWYFVCASPHVQLLRWNSFATFCSAIRSRSLSYCLHLICW